MPRFGRPRWGRARWAGAGTGSSVGPPTDPVTPPFTLATGLDPDYMAMADAAARLVASGLFDRVVLGTDWDGYPVGVDRAVAWVWPEGWDEVEETAGDSWPDGYPEYLRGVSFLVGYAVVRDDPDLALLESTRTWNGIADLLCGQDLGGVCDPDFTHARQARRDPSGRHPEHRWKVRVDYRRRIEGRANHGVIP